MTVADIQEYIDKALVKYDNLELMKCELKNIKSMLDELPRDYAQETIDDMEKALDNAWKKVLGSDNK